MLWIDCGHMLAGTHYTGIQRYLRQTLRQGSALLGPGLGAIQAVQGSWSPVPLLPPHSLESLPALALGGTAPRLDGSNQVLLADRFWHTQDWAALERLLRSDARISLVVYDLLSLQRPQLFPDGVGERFGRYLRAVLPRADDIVCLSQLVADELHEWSSRHAGGARRPVVVTPGARVWQGPAQQPAWLPESWAGGERPFVLQVGTLEPRKNHRLTLAALRQLWSQGLRVGALFIGQHGWGMDGFADELRALPQWGRDLLHVTECADPQLDWCYRHASAVIYPSAFEGYGLPLAEAAGAGATVIASETPIHEEVALALPMGSQVRRCGLDVDALALAIRSAVLGREPGARAASPPARDWKTATADLLTAIGALPTRAARMQARTEPAQPQAVV